MSDTRIDFSAPTTLRKWPSLNKQRVSASLGARPYLISEGTLDECIQQFMQLREGQRHLYEIHTAPQSDLVGAILSTEHVVELVRRQNEPAAKADKKGAINGVYKTGIYLGRRCQKVIDQVQHKAGPGSG
jgi:hypothetical protein